MKKNISKNEEKHIQNEEKHIQNEEKHIQNKENVVQNKENVVQNKENVVQCKKCNKTYKTLKFLIEHEKKCKGFDNLTCFKCMKSFSNTSNKSKHIKNNNCKARSIKKKYL